MAKTKTPQLFAQQLRPLLGSEFDTLNDEELEIVVNVIWKSQNDWLRSLIAAIPNDPKLRVKV